MIKKSVEILNENIVYYTDFEQLNNTKPIVLFIHGFGDSGIRVMPLINKKNKDYQLISIDLPGCGESSANTKPISLEFYAEVVNEFIKTIISNNDFYICTHSMGAIVALMIANFQKNLKWMLLATPAIYYNNPTDKFFVQDKINFFLPLNSQQLFNNSLKLVAPHEEKSIKAPLVAQKILATTEKELKKRCETFYFLVTKELLNYEYSQKIIKPLWHNFHRITIVYSGFDKVIPQKQVKELLDETGLENVYIENAGHAIFFSSPNLMNELITKMVKEKK